MFWPCTNNKPSRPQQRFQLTLAMTSGVCPIASKISMEDGMYTSLKYLTVSGSAPGNSILATSSIIFASNSVCTGPGSIRDNLWVERAGKSGVLTLSHYLMDLDLMYQCEQPVYRLDIKLEQLDCQAFTETLDGKLGGCVDVIKHYACADRHKHMF